MGIKRIINDKTETARKKNDKTIQPLCKRTASISSCTLAFFVDSEASTRDTYTVKLHAPNGLGLSWFVSYEGIVTVEGLHYLSDNSASPAQLCDLIKVGDQLIGFNETNLEILSFYDLTNIMKDVDRHAKVCLG